jgi:hypothetical protein
MHTTGIRLILIVFSLVACGGAAAAQSQRPIAARAVPADLLCGPQATLTPPAQSIRVVGGSEPMKALFATGDAVTINAGSAQGIAAGQHFFVRRVVPDRFTVRTTEKQPLSIHTAGWVTIVETQANVSIAKVSEACDGIAEGDYLEPFVIPAAATSASAAGEPDFARPARVILADNRRQLGAGGGSLMVIDRGSDHGLRAGQRLTVFRTTLDGSGPVMTIGNAFVASTQSETSLIRIETSREAIQVGDLIAIHR